jgi:hypothetical protein
MFIYYVEGDPRKNVAPDLFVTVGVASDPTRRTFRVWQEGKGPDFVLEVTSKNTRREDLAEKLEIYRDVLKVREYFMFDPLQEFLEPSLQGHRLVEGRFEPVALEAGRLPSDVLGLHLERDDLDLRLYNPRTGRWQPTSEEIEKSLHESELARQASEAARLREETRRFAAEAEAERLRWELDQLRKSLPPGS